MDPLSHAALGAAWAQPAAARKDLLTASILGCVAGMAPDLDTLIRSGTDPLLALEYHRHFTHSLAFVPVGALLCSLLVYPFFRKRISFAAAYMGSVLGFASHSLLDACTSYGTRLFWPFSDRRIAWDIVSVVDPLLTVPLIGLVLLGIWRRKASFALLGVAWCLCYLGLGTYQNRRATDIAAALAIARGHDAERIEVKPSLGNILLWKSIYERRGRYYIDAIRVRRGGQLFPGASYLKLELDRDFPWLEPGTQQWQDVERFRHFADGYIARDPQHPNRIVDIRYSLVPNRGDGLWGIELDPAAPPEAHATYVTMRFRSLAEGRELLQMIFR
jgi:inner membrane protein